MLTYLLCLIWAPFFVYLAERQFKRLPKQSKNASSFFKISHLFSYKGNIFSNKKGRGNLIHNSSVSSSRQKRVDTQPRMDTIASVKIILPNASAPKTDNVLKENDRAEDRIPKMVSKKSIERRNTEIRFKRKNQENENFISQRIVDVVKIEATRRNIKNPRKIEVISNDKIEEIVVHHPLWKRKANRVKRKIVGGEIFKSKKRLIKSAEIQEEKVIQPLSEDLSKRLNKKNLADETRMEEKKHSAANNRLIISDMIGVKPDKRVKEAIADKNRELSKEKIDHDVEITRLKKEKINRNIMPDSTIEELSRNESVQLTNDYVGNQAEDWLTASKIPNSQVALANVPSMDSRPTASLSDSEKKKYRKYKIRGWLLILIAILVPALVAGLKSFDVGKDLNVNVEGPVALYQEHHGNFFEYMSDNEYVDYRAHEVHLPSEPGYKILIYVLASVTTNMNFILFALQFLTMLFIIFFAYKNRDIVNMTLVTVIYLLVMYYQSFTTMRQDLAIAIAFFAIALFWKKEYRWALVWYLVAVSIHTSTLVMLIIFALIALSQSKLEFKRKYSIYGIYIGLIAIGVLFAQQIVYFLTYTIPLLPEKYYYYLSHLSGLESGWVMLITSIIFIALSLIYIKSAKKKKVDGGLIFVLLVTNLLTILMSFKMEFSYRIGWPFEYLGLFLLIPNLSAITSNVTRKALITAGCIGVLFLSWSYKLVVQQWSNLYPYKSDILHISRQIDIENTMLSNSLAVNPKESNDD